MKKLFIKSLFASFILTLSLNARLLNAEISYGQLPDGVELVYIQGEYDTETLKEIANLPISWAQTIVMLNSDGGSLFDSVSIGSLIRSMGALTWVLPGDKCLSECALIWLAGRNRILSSNGVVGFKGMPSMELTQEQQNLVGPSAIGIGDLYTKDMQVTGLGFVVLGNYLNKGLGIDFSFVENFIGTLTSSDDIIELNVDLLNSYGIYSMFDQNENIKGYLSSANGIDF